jgi:hypothetical protein
MGASCVANARLRLNTFFFTELKASISLDMRRLHNDTATFPKREKHLPHELAP